MSTRYWNLTTCITLIYKTRASLRSLIMGAYFCHHLSDNYVDLSELNVNLSVIYVDLSNHFVDLSEKYNHN